MSSGQRFRDLVASTKPLQIVGTINAYTALQAEQQKHQAIYLSGAGVANASFGIPDLGITMMNDVLEDARRITAVSHMPLLVDIDTGWGNALCISRVIKEITRAGVAAVHIEDQVVQKRCGHRPNKKLVSCDEMVDRIKAAVDARSDESFVIMARTDAIASEGLNAALDRMQRYREAGADMMFPEAVASLEDFAIICSDLSVPVLANITEFGQTPLFNCRMLADSGVSMVLYPLSAFRAMSKAAENVYACIFSEGSQSNVVSTMQSREDLYKCLDYHAYERAMDNILKHSSS
ncbi:2-methylisocitrate lyase [invertebrate metagenome]|uniref:2-methylisocitrate lyase n=1 Tax=invertebrate metagenome TaxID=1711999 RepID=A0A2H9T4N2_9ZZZZ